MERLTDKNAVGNYFYPKCFEKCDGFGASSKCDNCEIMTSVCEKLGKYEDLEEQDRLIKLPCKIGDTVYEIAGATTHGYGYVWKYLTYEKAYVHETVFNLFRLNDIGKTVFLTKSEAEAKLKELRCGENE